MKKLQLLVLAAASLAMVSSANAFHIFNYDLKINGVALHDNQGNWTNPEIFDNDGIVNVTWSTYGDNSFGDTESFGFNQSGGTLSTPGGGFGTFDFTHSSFSVPVNFGQGGTWQGTIYIDSADSSPDYDFGGGNQSGDTPSFGFSLVTGVPDAGSTVGLLGLAATTLGAFSFRRKKS